MLFLTRWFGVTGNDSERNLAREQADIEEIVERSLLMQANAAAQQHRGLCRGTHAKGACVRAQFEVFDATVERDRGLAARLARGIFATPGVYPAMVRFANADPNINSDFTADVRSLSFSVDLTGDGTAVGKSGQCVPHLVDVALGDHLLSRRFEQPSAERLVLGNRRPAVTCTVCRAAGSSAMSLLQV
jgi:hypothetical protein